MGKGNTGNVYIDILTKCSNLSGKIENEQLNPAE